MKKLTHSNSKLITVLIDIVLINLAYLLAIHFKYNGALLNKVLRDYKTEGIIVTIIFILVFYLFKLYESLWNYASIDEFMLIIAGCIVANLIAYIYQKLSGSNIIYSVNILAGIISCMFICGFRVSFRLYSRYILSIDKEAEKPLKRVMIIGAGQAGSSAIKEMNMQEQREYKPVAVIDDDKHKIGTAINRIKVKGDRNSIEKIAKDESIDVILVAIPSLDNKNKKEIIDICKRTKCKVKIIPSIYNILDEKVMLSKMRDVDVEDLLGRETVKLDMNGIADYVQGNNIMVTGGGGSIGSELCRQIAKFRPKQLIILDIYENNAYELQNELKYKYPKLNMKVLIGSVRDKKRLDYIFRTYKPEVVFHAAAHKHVPLMEDSPMEAVKNNVFGTLYTTECADKYGAKRFVLISTDKAVNPTNVMGATKRMCEMIVQSMDKVSKTQFVAVRFGNVLGSNGSVIPLFKKQIAQGGPVTVTNKYITRFFMTIPEAAKLVLQAGAFANGGEIFVLDMGEPVKIYDLAHDLIKLSGYEPDKDIKIEITGLRPGEKLYEELLMNEEGLQDTKHKKIFIGKPTFSDIDKLKKSIDELKKIINEDNYEKLINKIHEVVPTYKIPGYEYVAVTAEDDEKMA